MNVILSPAELPAAPKNIIFKILFIFNFLLLTYVLVVLRSLRVTGYENSIYANISYDVKIAIVFVAVSSILIVMYYLVSKQSLFYAYLALITLILVRVVILCIPYIRGYVGWEADHLTHYGFILDIIHSGDIGISNAYPMMHILLADVGMITGVFDLKYFTYSNVLISILYVLGIYLLSKPLSEDREYRMIVLLLTSIVIFDRYNVSTTPNGWSILLMPLVFYLYFKENWNFRVLLVIMIGLYSYIHPISSIFLALSFVFIYMTDLLFTHHSYPEGKIRSPFNLVSILLILFLPWILSFRHYQQRLSNLVESLTSPSDMVSPLTVVEDTASRLDIQGVELAKLVFKSMGDDLIFCFVAFILLVLYVLRSRSNYRLYLASHEMRTLLSVFSLVGIIYVLYLSGISGSLSYFQPGRIISYHQVVTPLLAAYFFYNLLKSNRISKYGKSALLLLFIVATSLISISSLYASDYTADQNWGVMGVNVQGMSWFVQHKSEDIDNIRILVLPTRYSSAVIGDNESRNRWDLHSVPVSDHFNYTNNTYLGENYEKNKYFPFFKYEKIVYTNVWENVERFNYGDFELLEKDKSVFKLYSNGEYTTYYVSSM